ncbi:MAG: sigma-70 family RNA polymerase sigma factor [Acidobacteriota bacterium]|nr:sigma-70 family RNA polymerase sigma factor [Acidobacteriota bacterium]
MIQVSPAVDPSLWVDQHGDYLYRFALLRLRDPSAAEDVVQETLLAALQARGRFAGRGSERTWLTGILKHKIIDHFRRAARTHQPDGAGESWMEHGEMFQQSGEWVGHWDFDNKADPVEWKADPETALERSEFREALGRCLSGLPERVARAFTLREVEGMAGEEICDVLGVTANNLWVMLHRARAQLRHCLEMGWFRRVQH